MVSYNAGEAMTELNSTADETLVANHTGDTAEGATAEPAEPGGTKAATESRCSGTYERLWQEWKFPRRRKETRGALRRRKGPPSEGPNTQELTEAFQQGGQSDSRRSHVQTGKPS